MLGKPNRLSLWVAIDSSLYQYKVLQSTTPGVRYVEAKAGKPDDPDVRPSMFDPLDVRGELNMVADNCIGESSKLSFFTALTA